MIVQITEVSAEQIFDGQRMMQEFAEKQLRFARQLAASAIVEAAQRRVDLMIIERAQEQPLAREVIDQRARTRIGEHTLGLPREPRRALELAALGGAKELRVGHGAPQKI